LGYFGSGTHTTGRTCQACKTDCKKCHSGDGVSSVCTMCGSSRYLSKGTCVAACPLGYLGVGNSATNRNCQHCLADCNLCSSLSTCAMCANSTYLLNNRCLAACPSRYVGVGFGATGRLCQACDTKCRKCASASICTVCSNSLYLHDGDCLAACPSGTVGAGTGTEGRFCPFACQTDCLFCPSPTTCTGCTNFKYLTNGDCATVCPSGHFGGGRGRAGRSCYSCGANCNTCASLSTCAVCGFSKYLSNSACVAACPGGYFHVGVGALGRTCQACKKRDCYKCTPNGECILCGNSTYFMNGDCNATCPSGYIGRGSNETGRSCRVALAPEEEDMVFAGFAVDVVFIIVVVAIGGVVLIAMAAICRIVAQRCCCSPASGQS